MVQIEVDFEVYKAMTNYRESENVTYNDVLRRLLKLPPAESTALTKQGGVPWVVASTRFPAGSEFIVEYKGKTYSGISKDGKLELSDGYKFSTPSAAAIHVT